MEAQPSHGGESVLSPTSGTSPLVTHTSDVCSGLVCMLKSETEGDMPCDDSDLAPDPDLALPGYTPGWRLSMPSSPLSSPSVSVSGPGLGHQRDWGWDPGGVRAAGGGLGWAPCGAAARGGV